MTTPSITLRTGCLASKLSRRQACIVCRKRKQKCDANKPECWECRANGSRCQYSNEEYKTRTTVTVLQETIKELEVQIHRLERSPTEVPHGISPDPGLSPELSSASPVSSGPTTPPTVIDSVEVVLPYLNSLLTPATPPQLLPKQWPYDELTLLGSERSGPSAEVTSYLLGVFIKRHVQCAFELDMEGVMRGLQPDAAEPIIPALYNAMLLTACHFTEDPESKMWEGVFLERTKIDIESNVARAHEGRLHNYNSLHHLAAMSLFGLYFYLKGRLLEGYVHTCQATRFAMVLGLHKLSSGVFRGRPTLNAATKWGLVEPWHPRDQRELVEAINAWWKCYGFDMAGSILNGLPASISPEEITTVWPRSLPEYESGQVIPDDDFSVESLFNPLFSHILLDSSQDNLKCLLAKACILLTYSAKFGTELTSGVEISDEWWMRFKQADRSVNRFIETMPPIYPGRNNEEISYLIIVHSGVYCAQVQLHSTLAEYEIAQVDQGNHQADSFLRGVSYKRCTEACRATALAAALVSHVDMSNMLPFIGVAWASVAEVLIRHISLLKLGGKITEAREKEQQLAIIERCMERCAATYPIFWLQLKQLQRLKE